MTYYLKCKKDTERTDSKLLKIIRPMLLSKCIICGNKKSRCIKEQQGKRLLSSLGIKTSLNKIPLLGDILF